MPESKRPLKVFLCHASQDKPAVRELYRRLVHDGVDVWLDETNLLPGMDWQLEIPRAVRNADAIIICLSDKSVTKEGYVQKEIRFALDAADEKPDGTIYLIPVRLNECIIPSRLTRWQWVDYFSSDGYRKLRLSLRLRAESIGAVMYSTDRKQESGSVDARNSSAKTAAGYKVHFGLVGMIFALLLAVSGILWAGGRMFNAETPSLMPISSLTPMETMTVTQTATLTPFQPNLMPVATTGLLIPTVTLTPVPTQTAPPTSTFIPPSPTAVPPTPTAPMVLIPAGSFIMGNDSGSNDAKPAHVVYLDAFYIYKYEVTNRAYSRCVDAGVCKQPVNVNSIAPDDYYSSDEYKYHPVINVSWEMAMTYCTWSHDRLPTEAEWEKAARGGLQGMPFPWGIATPVCEEDAVNGARFDNCVGNGPKKTGYYAPNGYEIFDMLGNVSEWVNDWYALDYYMQNVNNTNPHGPDSGTYRVLRGGNWAQNNTIYLFTRERNVPETQSDQIGFRCARDAAP